MIENSEQKKRRIMGRQFLPKYMNSLNQLLINKISPDNLLSIVETDSFYSQIDYEKKSDVTKTILFKERKNVYIILKEYPIDFNENYILWIEYTNDCGALKLKSLNNFNFEFPFNSSKNGIITLTQIDYKYQILFDFYEENNTKYLDIEIFFRIKK